MAQLDGVDQSRLRRNGLLPMAPQRAVDALRRSLGYGDTTLLVTNVDWESFVPTFTTTRKSPLLAEVAVPTRTAPSAEEPAAGEPVSDAFVRRFGATRRADREHLVLDMVCAHVAEVLGYRSSDAVEVGRGFLELGFDSLTAVELRNRLTARTGLALPPTVVFDYPTVEALAQQVYERLVAHVSEHAPTDPREAEVRNMVASIPLERLEEAGLLDRLIDLANDTANGARNSGDMPDEDDESLDDMDVASLVRMAREDLGA